LHEQRLAVAIAHHRRAVLDPNDPAVGAHVAVVAAVRLARREERLVVLPRAVPIVRVQYLVPDGVAGQEPIRGDAEELLDIGAHRERHAAELRLVRIDRARHLPEQGLVPGLRFERPSFGVAQARLEVGAMRPLHAGGIGMGEPLADLSCPASSRYDPS
jgi:hypothetical protein